MQLGFEMRTATLIQVLVDEPVIDKMIKARVSAQVFCKIVGIMFMKPSRLEKAPCGDDALKRVSDYGEFPGVLICNLWQCNLILPDRLVAKNNLAKQTLLHRITGTFGYVDKNAAQLGYLRLQLIRDPGRPT